MNHSSLPGCTCASASSPATSSQHQQRRPGPGAAARYSVTQQEQPRRRQHQIVRLRFWPAKQDRRQRGEQQAKGQDRPPPLVRRVEAEDERPPTIRGSSPSRRRSRLRRSGGDDVAAFGQAMPAFQTDVQPPGQRGRDQLVDRPARQTAVRAMFSGDENRFSRSHLTAPRSVIGGGMRRQHVGAGKSAGCHLSAPSAGRRSCRCSSAAEIIRLIDR